VLGTGLLQGLAVTAKNLVGSFHDPKRFVTTEYPEQKTKLPENYRNFPFLVYEGEDPIATLRCVACKICENECPPQCIYIIPDRDEKGRPAKKPKVFDIDISVCMSCQICVEVCPFDAIKMDQHYEIAQSNRFNGLLLHREQLAKPNGYFHQLHPAEANEVDTRLAEVKRAAEEKAKAAAAAKASSSAKASEGTAPKPAPAAGPSGAARAASTTPATTPKPASVAGLGEAGQPGSATPATTATKPPEPKPQS
jgi:NADH-quinone oxidoreductase subunit I